MAFKFVNASSQALELAQAVGTAPPLTFAAWFNPATVHTGAICAIDTNGGVARHVLMLDTGSVQVWAQSVTSVGGTSQATTSTTYQTNRWQHACAVFAAVDSRIAYLNGGGAGSEGTSRSVSGVNLTNIGNRWSTTKGNHFNGLLAEIAIWTCALTPAEILEAAGGKPHSLIRPEALALYLPLSAETYLREMRFNRLQIAASNAPTLNAWHPPVTSAAKRKLRLVPAAGSRSASGALAEGVDAAAASAGVRVSGVLSRTEAADGFAASAAVALHASGALPEGKDSAAASAAVKLAASGAFAESHDGAVLAGRVALSGAAATYESNDASAGHIGSGAPAVIDSNFLFVARPRVRTATAASRSRALVAFPRIRRAAA